MIKELKVPLFRGQTVVPNDKRIKINSLWDFRYAYAILSRAGPLLEF